MLKHSIKSDINLIDIKKQDSFDYKDLLNKIVFKYLDDSSNKKYILFDKLSFYFCFMIANDA